MTPIKHVAGMDMAVSIIGLVVLVVGGLLIVGFLILLMNLLSNPKTRTAGVVLMAVPLLLVLVAGAFLAYVRVGNVSHENEARARVEYERGRAAQRMRELELGSEHGDVVVLDPPTAAGRDHADPPLREEFDRLKAENAALRQQLTRSAEEDADQAASANENANSDPDSADPPSDDSGVEGEAAQAAGGDEPATDETAETSETADVVTAEATETSPAESKPGAAADPADESGEDSGQDSATETAPTEDSSAEDKRPAAGTETAPTEDSSAEDKRPPAGTGRSTHPLEHETGDPLGYRVVLVSNSGTSVREEDAVPRPSWADPDQKPFLEDDICKWPVRTDPYRSDEECAAALPAELRKAVLAYQTKRLGRETAKAIDLPEEFMIYRMVEENWVEPVETSFGTWYQLHALVAFDESVNQEIDARLREQAMQVRLWNAGAAVGGCLVFLAAAYAYLKAWQNLGARGRWRLRATLIVGILVMVAAAGLLLV